MKIGIDIDGTLTNFEKFLVDNSQEYMKKNYNLALVNPSGYDIDQMYNIESILKSEGENETRAKQMTKQIVDKFWKRYYLKYLFTSFRDNIGKMTKKLYFSNNEVCILSSRKKTTEKSLIGYIVKYSTILMLRLKGIKSDEIVFFETDEEKMEYIKKRKFDLLFDDKPELINQLQKFTNVIYVDSHYNNDVESNDRTFHISDFSDDQVIDSINQILDKRGEKAIDSGVKVNIYHRLLKYLEKKEEDYKFTDRCYKLMKFIGKPIVMRGFRPIIINKERANIKPPVIVSPNHRSTLDPFFVIASTKFPIHWVGLKRFFNAEDSIFNNSKKTLLRKSTSLIFRAIGAIPIERLSDNPKANNRDSVLRLIKMIKDSQVAGVFPEGTTNKNPEVEQIGTSDRSGNLAFALIRENPGSLLLPISISWIRDQKKIGNKVIINYRHPISLKDINEYINEHEEMKFLSAAEELWEKSIIQGLEENRAIEEDLLKRFDEKNPRSKTKVYYNERRR